MSLLGYLSLLEASGASLLRRRREHVAVVREEQARLEGHLQTLADALHDGARNALLDLLGLLIHLVADHRARGAADRSADDRASGRGTGRVADHGADGGAGACTDEGAGFLLVWTHNHWPDDDPQRRNETRMVHDSLHE